MTNKLKDINEKTKFIVNLWARPTRRITTYTTNSAGEEVPIINETYKSILREEESQMAVSKREAYEAFQEYTNNFSKKFKNRDILLRLVVTTTKGNKYDLEYINLRGCSNILTRVIEDLEGQEIKELYVRSYTDITNRFDLLQIKKLYSQYQEIKSKYSIKEVKEYIWALTKNEQDLIFLINSFMEYEVEETIEEEQC